MHVSHAKILILAAGTAQLASAHTAFTNFFVNGVNQGDGTAVRMSNNMQKATFPLSSVTSPDMACGESAFHLLFPVKCPCMLHVILRQLIGFGKLQMPS